MSTVVKNKVKIKNEVIEKRIVTNANKSMQIDKMATRGLMNERVQFVYANYPSLRKLLVRAKFNL